MKQEIILKIKDLNKEQIEQILKIINDSGKKHRYKPQSKEELITLIEDESIYLGDIDTSLITDMSDLFYLSERTDFSGIEKWNVSNVEDMSCMFYKAELANPDVSSWDVSNVVNMRYMFCGAEQANPDVSSWDVSNVEDMSYMFLGATNANPDISRWNISKIKYATETFVNSSFDYNTLKSTNFDLNKFF